MKKKLLTLLVFLLGSIVAYSQAELTVVAPSVTVSSTQFRAPNGLTSHTTLRGVIVIPASELNAIPSGTIITKLSLILSATSTVPAGGTIQYYLENTADVTNLKSTDWATIIAPMTSVYTGTFTLPTVAGPTGDLALTTGFVYAGGSVYVAFDYLGTTFTTTPYTYSANSSLTGGWKGLATSTTTPAATLTEVSGFRPCFRFTIANPFTNELNVTGVAGEKGIFNNTISQNQTVTSLISNTSNGTLTNIPVTLTITGANPYTTTQVIPSINAGQTLTLTFSNVPTINIGSQVITISIPADQNNTNNSLTFNQEVQCNKISYAQGTVQSGSVGFNTGAGVIAVKHVIPNNVQTFVKTVSNYFPSTANIAGNTIKGLLFDTNGAKIDSTAVINITPGMLNTKQDFNFINGNINVAGQTVYIGFRQVANTTVGYFPFANQNNSYVDPNAAGTLPLYGGVISPAGSGLGYIMIEATFDYGGFNVANSSPNGRICANSTLNITPIPGYSNYEFIVNGSTVQNGPTATYTTAPLTATTTYNVIITNGSCTLSSNLSTVNVGVEAGAIQIAATPDTAKTICVGEGTDDLIAVEFVNTGVLTGDNSIWVITDQVTGNIISTQISGPFNLESIPSGVYNIWYLSYVGDIGLATATNVSQLSGCFDLSNSIEVTTLSGTACSVLNTDDFSNDQNFKFYPNPTTSVLNIDYIGLRNLDLNISVQNILGSKIFEKKYEKGHKNISLDFNSYTDGIYFVNITDNESGGTLIKKVVKN